jgi:transcriptional repressor NrdR
MLCPECKKSDTKVLDSRDDDRTIRRRRECLRCRYRFTTYERVESPRVKVIKRNGAIEDYQRGKLAKGIHLALEKRPFTCIQVESVIDAVEHEITKLKSKQLTSKQIGKFVLDRLLELDDVAYLRFLSVYKSFGSASKFQREAEKIVRNNHET